MTSCAGGDDGGPLDPTLSASTATLRSLLIAQTQADHVASTSIEHHRQISPLTAHLQIRHVTDPYRDSERSANNAFELLIRDRW